MVLDGVTETWFVDANTETRATYKARLSAMVGELMSDDGREDYYGDAGWSSSRTLGRTKSSSQGVSAMLLRHR